MGVGQLVRYKGNSWEIEDVLGDEVCLRRFIPAQAKYYRLRGWVSMAQLAH